MSKRFIGLALVVMMVLSVLGACSSAPATTSAPEDSSAAVTSAPAASSTDTPAGEATGKKYTIGFVNSDIGADDYRTNYDKYFRAYAEKFPDVELTVLDAKSDINTQLSMIDTMIQKKVDLLLVWATDSKGIVAGLKKAKEAGITTVACNNPIDASGDQYIATWVGPDVYFEGKSAAEAANAAYPNGGNFVCIPGMTGYDTVTLRLKGFTDNVNPNIKILDTQFSKSFAREEGQKLMENYLATYGDQINGVFTLDDNLAIGAAQAVKAAGAKNIGFYFSAWIGSKESYDYIKDGTLAAGVLQHPLMDSQGTFDVCYQILTKGTSGIQPKQYIKLFTCTKDNIDQIIKENSLEIFGQ